MLAMTGAVRAHGGLSFAERPVSEWIGLPLHDMVRWMIGEGLVAAADLEAVVAHFRAHYPACAPSTRACTTACGRCWSVPMQQGGCWPLPPTRESWA